MAKQAVGPLVRYLDKGVLALCAGAFLFVVAVYGVVSPNKAGNPGEEVGPGDVGQEIKVAAESLRESVQRAKPKPPGSDEPPLPEVNPDALDDPLALAGVPESLPSPVPPGLPVPQRPGEVQATTYDLVEVLALGKPMLQTGRSGVYLEPPAEFKPGAPPKGENAAFLQDANWVTVYAVFDRTAQEKAFRDAGYGNYAQPVFLGVDIQRRMQRPGGWTEWSAIEPAQRMRTPTAPPIEVRVNPDGVPTVDEGQRADIESFEERITAGTNNEAQCDLMRPLFAATDYGDQWRYPRLPDADVLVMDAEYQDTAQCRYPECAGTGTQIDKDLDLRDLLKRAREALDNQDFDTAKDYAQAAFDRAEREDRQGDIRKAQRLLDEIEVAVANAKLARNQASKLATQLVWTHDAGADNLLSGRTYQYRMRAKLFNRLAGKPAPAEQSARRGAGRPGRAVVCAQRSGHHRAGHGHLRQVGQARQTGGQGRGVQVVRRGVAGPAVQRDAGRADWGTQIGGHTARQAVRRFQHGRPGGRYRLPPPGTLAAAAR
jgi:hypothetical protein